MSDRGKFSGFSWHNEFHAIDRKKEKAADCIYMRKDRTCSNEKSLCFSEKCFEATRCHLRVKKNQKEANLVTSKKDKVKKLIIKSIKCTLPKNCKIIRKDLVEGEYIDFIEDKMHLVVKFNGKVWKYQYPKAILEGFISVSDEEYKCVLNDIDKAKKV